MTFTLKSKAITSDKVQDMIQLLMKNTGKVSRLFANNSAQFMKYREELLNRIINPPEDNNFYLI